MIHNHSSGKHGLLRKMLAVCIAFAMICSVSISAFSVEASSENTDETVQSVMTEEEGDPEAAEAETDSEQTPGEEQTEEPEVTPPEDNVENPDADNAEPTPSEDNEQPADPTVTEQPEEPTVTEQPTATPTQVEELEKDKADSEVQTQDAKAKWPTPTPASSTTYSGKAAIYYHLANPAGDPWTNDTGAWAPAQETSNTIGNINTDGATWEDGYVGNTVYKEKNIKSNVSKYITSWPDGSKGTTWTVKRGDATTGSYFTFVLDSIWDNYKTAISKDTGIALRDLNKEDILEITLTPRKISRDNGGTYPYHIDCALSIKSKSVFTAKFWVKDPGETDYTQVDAKNYKTGDSVVETTKAEIGSTKEVNGIIYVLDGWYPENETGGAYKDQKITNWNYTPNATELADGTVNFYAHYTPLYTSVNIKKLVTGNMGDKSKPFHFKVSVVKGNTNLPFKIDKTQYTDPTEITLSDNQTTALTQVPVGATVTITEDNYSGYTTSCTIDGSASAGGRTATISNIQQNNENAAHEVTFTNNKEAIPDTGLNLGTTPYILALGIVALGAGLLLFGRRKRQS